MRAKVLTLRFSPQLGRFDDAPLVALQQAVVLERVRESLVQFGDAIPSPSTALPRLRLCVLCVLCG